MTNPDDDDDDAFWSVAMMSGADERLLQVHDESDDFDVDARWKTIKTPSPDPLDQPLVLRICENAAYGCLSDVSSNVWDASLLLAGFLYGISEGRQLCYNACFGQESTNVDKGGILELGSGLGLSGLAAAAAASALAKYDHHERTSRVVLTDLNNDDILSLLRQNVETNLSAIIGKERRLHISVEPLDFCDMQAGSSNNCCPAGTFNLIVGSELVYVPEHVACADTISHYLCRNALSQAIILQIPDRAGFDAFLSRCRELDLLVSSRAVSEDITLNTEEEVPSASDYRMYFIRKLKSD